MTASFTKGFTIIETMLVLSITAILVSTIMISVGASLNTQRYRDSVESLKTTLQAQFSELSSVQNARDNTWSCGDTAEVTDDARQVRGQSNCVLLGKLVSINGGEMTIKSVVGIAKSTATASDDIASLRNNYTLGVSQLSPYDRPLEWDTVIAKPARVNDVNTSGPLSPRQLSLLFLRSPDSGYVYVFSRDGVSDAPTARYLKDMIGESDARTEKIVCVDPNGLNPPEKMSIIIGQNASSPGSIETKSNGLLEQGKSAC